MAVESDSELNLRFIAAQEARRRRLLSGYGQPFDCTPCEKNDHARCTRPCYCSCHDSRSAKDVQARVM